MSVNRFLGNAKAGRMRGASSGERTCNEIVRALAKVGDDVMLLDRSTVEGICEVIRAMRGPFETDAQKDAVFAAINQAAGR